MVVPLPLLLFHFSKSFSSFQVEYHIPHNTVSLSFLLCLLCAPTVPHALGNYVGYCILLTTIPSVVLPLCSWKAEPLYWGPGAKGAGEVLWSVAELVDSPSGDLCLWGFLCSGGASAWVTS